MSLLREAGTATILNKLADEYEHDEEMAAVIDVLMRLHNRLNCIEQRVPVSDED